MSNKALDRFITDPTDFSKSKNPEDSMSQNYLSFYKTIGKAIESKQSSARTNLDLAMNIVLDGNLYSLDGYSGDKAIETVQRKANEVMLDLYKINDLPKLDTVSLNSAINASIIIPNDDEDSPIYYQNVDEEHGEFVSTKASNIFRNIFIQPSKILYILKNIYLIGNNCVTKELISFVWVFWETVLFFAINSRIKLTPKQVCVILYIQKFATPFIDTETLIQKIDNNELQFDTLALKDLAWKEGEIKEVVNQLLELKVIKNYNYDNNKVYLIEKVSLDIPIQHSSES